MSSISVARQELVQAQTLSSYAPVSFKLFILSHMQECRNRATRYMPGKRRNRTSDSLCRNHVLLTHELVGHCGPRKQLFREALAEILSARFVCIKNKLFFEQIDDVRQGLKNQMSLQPAARGTR
jgi:hypothetical protein